MGGKGIRGLVKNDSLESHSLNARNDEIPENVYLGKRITHDKLTIPDNFYTKLRKNQSTDTSLGSPVQRRKHEVRK